VITVRRAEQRHHARRRKQEIWFSFYSHDRADSLADGFGALEILNEARVPPGAGVTRVPRHDAEIVTYVREGALTYQDAKGHTGVIQAGEFQRVTARRGVSHSETNASRTDWAHAFQAWLRPAEPRSEPGHEQKRFSIAERRGLLRIIASPDARRGSLRINQDALMYSALLHPGQHLVHELSHGRSAWLHIVAGEVTLRDVVLTTGDGAGISAERAVSLTAREETELLLVDLGQPPPAFIETEDVPTAADRSQPSLTPFEG
jgi:redox-sensitive bicupin YhaK (pirin superfamily)